MTTKDEALRLADALEQATYLLSVERDNTAAELRRLHGENKRLKAAARPAPDYKALWQQMCERCDELDKELSATDRQVEILSDALAESRREVAALKANAALDKKAENARELGLDYEPAPVQEPVLEVVNGQINRAWDAIPAGFTGMLYMQSPLNVPPKKPQEPWYGSARVDDYNRGWNDCVDSITTPPAAQRQWVGLTDEERFALEYTPKGVKRTPIEMSFATEAKLKEKNNG